MTSLSVLILTVLVIICSLAAILINIVSVVYLGIVKPWPQTLSPQTQKPKTKGPCGLTLKSYGPPPHPPHTFEA